MPQEAESAYVGDGSTSIYTRAYMWLTTYRWHSHSDWLGVSTLGAVLISFWLHDGFWGGAAWVVVAITWVVFPVIVPVTLGQFALVAITPADAEFITLLPGSISLLTLLVADIAATRQRLLYLFTLIVSAIVFSGSAIWVIWLFGIQVAVIGLIMLFGVISYLLHRWLLLLLGHLPGDSDISSE